MSSNRTLVWPLLLCVCVYWTLVAGLVSMALAKTGGILVYPLDDTYIHMAMARNVAESGVWGVTKHGFTSSSSGPLWTGLLALSYGIFGVNDLSPLVLNLLFGTSIIVVAYVAGLRYLQFPARVAVLLIVTIVATPLPLLTFIGMEHVLHALLSLSVVLVAVRIPDTRNGPWWTLPLLALFVAATRYEGLLLIAAVCALLLVRKQVVRALTTGIAALLPVLFYGTWSMSHGWFLLPNSVLTKVRLPGTSSEEFAPFVLSVLRTLMVPGHLLVLLLGTLLTFGLMSRDKAQTELKYANLIVSVSIVLHVLFGRAGVFYRYEAYLVLLAVITIACSIGPLCSSLLRHAAPRHVVVARAMVVLTLVCGVLLLGTRAAAAMQNGPRASANIHGQHYQMGRFVERFYEGHTVLVNDIGAVAYMADAHLVDLWGLGTLEPAALRMEGTYGTDSIRDLAAGGDIAIVYDEWYGPFGGLPQEWARVARWTIPDNIVCASDTVSFYAVSPRARLTLERNLRQFSSELPSGVQVRP
jgi:hypothetical protein